ncbi:unnamed protein product [Schistosoma margrebowiei]|uniref:Uncharacterized protein n=1 Tax=Schistosoma margrebowiei TaxID=48269 RepID=A0A183LJ80_9TREM|nr:unnamed protein product [Schistosoma margrebowiei]
MQLDNSDFTDHPAFLYHSLEQMQVKTVSVAAFSESVGLNTHKGKWKIIKYNTKNANPITLHLEPHEEVGASAYLSSIIDEQGKSDAVVKVKIDKCIKCSIFTTEQHMKLKTILSKPTSNSQSSVATSTQLV